MFIVSNALLYMENLINSNSKFYYFFKSNIYEISKFLTTDVNETYLKLLLNIPRYENN